MFQIDTKLFLLVGSLKRYETWCKIKSSEEATKTLSEIHLGIKNTVDATPDDIWRFAERLLQMRKHCFKSVPLFSSAASLYAERANQWNALSKCKQNIMAAVASCVKGIHLATVQMMVNDESNKTTIQHHVIPLMRDILARLEKVESVEKTSETVDIVSVLHSIGKSEREIHELRAAAITFEDALDRLDETFSCSETKPKIYSALWEDLGDVFVKMGRPNEVIASYRKAIEVHKCYTAEGER